MRRSSHSLSINVHRRINFTLNSSLHWPFIRHNLLRPLQYMWFFCRNAFSFRPYQLKGVKRKLILVVFFLSCVDTVYRVVLQVFGLSNSQLSVFQKIPLNIISLSSICWQVYLLTNHFWKLSSRATLFIKLTTPYCLTF